MQLSSVHIIFLVLTFAVTLLPGFLAARKIKSADDYNVGGRNASAGIVAGSIEGTLVGGAATVGTAQLGYILGLTAWWFTLGAGIALLVMALFYAGPLRRSGLTTISEFLGLTYGKTASVFASISASAGIFFSIMASKLTALHLVAIVFNVSVRTSSVIILTIAAALVFFGGISGSGMAGLLKVVFIFATIVVGGIFAFYDMGYWSGIQASFHPYPWFSLFGHGIQDAVFSLLCMLAGVLSTQSYVQAVFSAKDSKTAAAGCVGAAMVIIPVGLPSVMIGMFMQINHPEVRSIDALPMYLYSYLPDWLGGIGLAAVLLSALGSIAGLSMGIGTMVSSDIIRNIWQKLNSVQLLLISRICVLTVMVVAIVFVFFHLHSSILEWNYLSMALRGSGIFLPMTFEIFFPGKINAKAGAAAVIGGILVACLSKQLFGHQINCLFPALACNILFLLIGLAMGSKKSEAKE